jgi:hypothetical protein
MGSGSNARTAAARAMAGQSIAAVMPSTKSCAQLFAPPDIRRDLVGAYLEAASPAPAGIALPAQAPFEFMAAVTAQALGRAAATRSSQQRGSAGWLQSTTTRVTLSAGGIAPPSASRCLGRPKVVTLFHLLGDSHINLAKSRLIAASK